MRRDMDLVRDILREAADCGAGALDASVLVDGRRDFACVAYHIDIMREAGLVNATVKRAWGGSYLLAQVNSLTWAGQDYLASVSNDGLWSEVKRRVARLAGDVSMETVKALAVRIAAEMLA